MKQVNAKGPGVLGRLSTSPPLSPEAFERAAGNVGVQLVDNRQILGFGGGHIAGAMNIGPRAGLSIWAGWMLDPEEPSFLVLSKDTLWPGFVARALSLGYDGRLTELLPASVDPGSGPRPWTTSPASAA